MHRYLLVSDIFADFGSPRDPPVIRAIFPFSEKSFDTSTLGVSDSGMVDDTMNGCQRGNCTELPGSGVDVPPGRLGRVGHGSNTWHPSSSSNYYILPILTDNSTLISLKEYHHA
jgi:hypothetical protein